MDIRHWVSSASSNHKWEIMKPTTELLCIELCVSTVNAIYWNLKHFQTELRANFSLQHSRVVNSAIIITGLLNNFPGLNSPPIRLMVNLQCYGCVSLWRYLSTEGLWRGVFTLSKHALVQSSINHQGNMYFKDVKRFVLKAWTNRTK